MTISTASALNRAGLAGRPTRVRTKTTLTPDRKRHGAVTINQNGDHPQNSHAKVISFAAQDTERRRRRAFT
jgi:hypothetical protein